MGCVMTLKIKNYLVKLEIFLKYTILIIIQFLECNLSHKSHFKKCFISGQVMLLYD